MKLLETADFYTVWWCWWGKSTDCCYSTCHMYQWSILVCLLLDPDQISVFAKWHTQVQYETQQISFPGFSMQTCILCVFANVRYFLWQLANWYSCCMLTLIIVTIRDREIFLLKTFAWELLFPLPSEGWLILSADYEDVHFFSLATFPEKLSTAADIKYSRRKLGNRSSLWRVLALVDNDIFFTNPVHCIDILVNWGGELVEPHMLAILPQEIFLKQRFENS